jgi:HEAT repeat protein
MSSIQNTIAVALAFVVCADPRALARQAPAAPPQSAAPGGSPAPETPDVANGWILLAQGKADQAAARAAQALTANPRSGAALLLAIEADVVRGGALRGLGAYEKWLGPRTVEEPAALRRLATATLQEGAQQNQDAGARVEALRALAENGDRAASEQLAREAETANGAILRALASVGDEAAVKKLIAERKEGSAQTVTAIDALGASGSRLVAAPLVEYLKDERMEVKGAALNALRNVGGTQTVDAIKPLLADRTLYVRVQAAGALLRKGDDSGLPILQALLADPSPASRVMAAEALSTRPDAAWLTAVKALATTGDAETRATAAGLLAPHDPELAGRVLESLSTDPNPAIRDLAGSVAGDAASTVTNLTTLRHLLKSPDRRAKVRAAARLLTLTH